jgi:hypothetical protein
MRDRLWASDESHWRLDCDPSSTLPTVGSGPVLSKPLATWSTRAYPPRMAVSESSVRCDVEGCDALLGYPVESVDASRMINEGGRTFAHTQGWTSAGDEDYCPTHSK